MESKQCLNCKNFIGYAGEGMTCRAFPFTEDKIIPEEIIRGKFDHTKPFKGDNGIMFEPVDKDDLF